MRAAHPHQRRLHTCRWAGQGKPCSGAATRTLAQANAHTCPASATPHACYMRHRCEVWPSQPGPPGPLTAMPAGAMAGDADGSQPELSALEEYPGSAHRDSALHRLCHARWLPGHVARLLEVLREAPLWVATAGWWCCCCCWGCCCLCCVQCSCVVSALSAWHCSAGALACCQLTGMRAP